MPDQDKQQQGRAFDQLTQDGTSSAATMGTGGTGKVDTRSDTDKGYDEAARTPWVGGMQSAGRTDDLLSGGAEADQEGQGFKGTEGSQAGSGAGNRQSTDADERTQSLSGGGRPSDPTGLQGAAGNQQSGDGNQ